MAKKVAGLPEDFNMGEVPTGLGDEYQPVGELGDYLDQIEEEKRVINLVPPVETKEIPVTLESEKEPERLPSKRPAPPRKPKPPRRKEPPRKQINMFPDTLKKLDELVQYVRSHGPQSDAAASEVVDALISAGFEALPELNLSNVPARGRWGTPTARAYRQALEESFRNAISAK